MRIRALLLSLTLGVSSILVSGCLMDSSCFPAGGDKLLRATSAVAERIPVQFDADVGYDCEDGGRRHVLLKLIEKPGSLEGLSDICEFLPDLGKRGDNRYRCRLDDLKSSVESYDLDFPDEIDTIEVHVGGI